MQAQERERGSDAPRAAACRTGRKFCCSACLYSGSDSASAASSSLVAQALRGEKGAGAWAG